MGRLTLQGLPLKGQDLDKAVASIPVGLTHALGRREK